MHNVKFYPTISKISNKKLPIIFFFNSEFFKFSYFASLDGLVVRVGFSLCL